MLNLNKENTKCKECSGKLKLIFGLKSVHLSCMECGRNYPLQEYINKIDEKFWAEISCRPADRV